MSTDILNISEAAALIKAGQLSPVELTEMCLSRIKAYEPELHAFVTVTEDRARADARKAEAEIKALEAAIARMTEDARALEDKLAEAHARRRSLATRYRGADDLPIRPQHR